MQLEPGGAGQVPFPEAGPGKSPAEGPGKFDFYCSKGCRQAKFSAV